MNKVKVYKITTGEELIAEQFNNYDQHFELKNPAQIVLQRTEQGVGVALAPYMPYVEGNLNLGKHAILAEGVPNQQMINEYNRIFGSGIQVVSASALAGIR